LLCIALVPSNSNTQIVSIVLSLSMVVLLKIDEPLQYDISSICVLLFEGTSEYTQIVNIVLSLICFSQEVKEGHFPFTTAYTASLSSVEFPVCSF
jgi:hypothetical protein